MASGVENVDALNARLAAMRDHFRDVLKNLKRHNEAQRQSAQAKRHHAARGGYDPARDGLPPWVYESLNRITPGGEYTGTSASPATAPTPNGGD